jgi:hypothetical protein
MYTSINLAESLGVGVASKPCLISLLPLVASTPLIRRIRSMGMGRHTDPRPKGSVRLSSRRQWTRSRMTSCLDGIIERSCSRRRLVPRHTRPDGPHFLLHHFQARRKSGYITLWTWTWARGPSRSIPGCRRLLPDQHAWGIVLKRTSRSKLLAPVTP